MISIRGLRGGILRPTLVFVHGTGVRGTGYAATLRLIEQNVRRANLAVTVHGCFWGGTEGARLRAGGRSIPGYGATGGTGPSEADEKLALWSVLYTDPWYELRLLRNYPASSPVTFGQKSPATALRDAVTSYAPSAELRSELDDSGLGGFFDDALAAIRKAPEFQQASKTAPAEPLDHRRAIARALIAYTIVAAEDAGEPPPDGQVRDALAERVANELHGYGMSVSSFLLRPVKGMATRMVTRKLTGDRGSISDATAPAAGDILRFLADGDGARALVRQAISDVPDGPVLLLGHSLGGIICVDLLVRENIPSVAGLVTVGSQAPFLYEIGALPALTFPQPLPRHFPRWLNIYDRRDLLSYVGADVLGDTVTDVKVDNGQPFPQSHSAYWSNPDVWTAVAGAVP